MSSKERGSFEGWNNVWEKQSSVGILNPVYTEGECETIFQFWQRGYATDLLNLIETRKYFRFCELGSGRGTTTMYLAQSGYTDLTMVDLAAEAFKVARYSFKQFDLPIPQMVLADVENTGLPSDSYDCIYNIGLLEHFDDPSKTLAESYRLLCEGGMIFMPIVPQMPFCKSLLHRIVLHPISILKHVVKKAIGYRSSGDRAINRTAVRRAEYFSICEKLGYKNIKSIPYNPFWKVNHNQDFERKVTLPMYKWIYREFYSKRKLTFKTSSAVELCYLLVAYK